ncbi:hypothetical protein BC939DRAFT_523910 [Gamsiella multidivaricata]|uniref:uncharacterized protein n=1 Tax=Gamsiella multidivaricata TaxID=101098 RepID=UPI00221FA596|nr:uncharacterized protein BC939DRAFT_523910 [Gamsiella multidivaricata]KAI7817321.1 hypothetical protein BC939DRAFT_523910 [Gamsiella multidivaricata]
MVLHKVHSSLAPPLHHCAQARRSLCLDPPHGQPLATSSDVSQYSLPVLATARPSLVDLYTQSLRRRMTNILLPTADINVPTTSFAQATTGDFRRFAQLPFHKDKSEGMPAQWSKFWKKALPTQGRNLWWRYLQESLPHASFRLTNWPRVTFLPMCPVCHESVEDLDHYVVLCPSKRQAWISLLQHHCTKTKWSDKELLDLVSIQDKQGRLSFKDNMRLTRGTPVGWLASLASSRSFSSNILSLPPPQPNSILKAASELTTNKLRGRR